METNLFRKLRDFLYYGECAVCKLRLDDVKDDCLCPHCREKWDNETKNADLGRKFIPAAPLSSLSVLSLYRTHENNIARDLILLQKDYDSPAVNRFLAREISKILTNNLTDVGVDTVVCSVVRSKANIVDKGFNQAESLGRCVAGELSLRYVDALKYVGNNTVQHGLSPDERWKNAAKSYAINEYAISELSCRKVIIVDDVYTTGATLSSCAAILKKYGARRVDGAVVAISYPNVFDEKTGEPFPNEPLFY